MNTSEALKKARAMGLQVTDVRRTGEVRVRFPDGKTVTTSHPNRRKDCCAKLETRLRQLERERAALLGGAP